MSHPSYAALADLYDLVYGYKDYAAEAGRLRQLLLNAGVADGSRLLEVACGTGRHLEALSAWYDVAGCDLNPEMLAIARGRCPDVELFTADMVELAVERPYDVLVCLFSSIGYAGDVERLRRAAGCFADAVRDGGVLVIEPFHTAEMFEEGATSLLTHEDGERKVVRASSCWRDGTRAVVDLQWLIADPGRPVAHHRERHELGLFTRGDFLGAFRDAGIEGRWLARGLFDDRGLLVGRRREG